MASGVVIGVCVGCAFLALFIAVYLWYKYCRKTGDETVPLSRAEEYDFHGMTLREAMDIADRVLGNGKRREIRFITGRGLHSPNGIPVIKNALERDLDKRGLPYRHEHKGGVVVVDLRGGNGPGTGSCFIC